MIIIDGAKECSLQTCLLILPSLSLLLASLASLLVASFSSWSCFTMAWVAGSIFSRASWRGPSQERPPFSFLLPPPPFGVALCRRLRLGQLTGLGQDLQSTIRQLVFVGLEKNGCCFQNPGRLALQPGLFQDPGDVALIGFQDRLENVIFQCSVLLHQEVLLPVRPRGTNEMKSISTSPKSNSWDMQIALPDAEGLMNSGQNLR